MEVEVQDCSLCFSISIGFAYVPLRKQGRLKFFRIQQILRRLIVSINIEFISSLYIVYWDHVFGVF